MTGQADIFSEIIVDNFAGGGGASTGIELATGRIVDLAINHDPDAILMHQTNHPHTEHLQASVWDVDPVEVCRGRPVGLAWFSPDCKHFSKAKGGKPVSKNIRGLAWIVLRWAALVRPRVIILENVEEFQTWGPVRRGHPVKSKQGQTFRKWKQQLSDLGFDIEHRELVAADYGAPTIRKRFFLVARCDGELIVWPEPTHAKDGANGLKPWRAAAEIIDWYLPCPSIFADKAEIKAQYGLDAVRPLADNTLRRVIRGVDKFTIKSWSEIRALLNAHCGYELADNEILLLGMGGTWYYIADIGLRMLTPRELYNAQGFPPDYIIDRDYMGNEYGKTKQVARCGNAVCPPLATALVRANLPEWCSAELTTMAALMDAVAV